MKKLLMLIPIAMIFTMYGCASDYIYHRSEYVFNDSIKLDKKEAAKKLVTLMTKYKSKFRKVTPSDFFNLHTGNLQETINNKFKFEMYKEDNEKMILAYTNKECTDADKCLKGFIAVIFKTKPKICKVKSVHKKTKEVVNYFELKSFMFSLGSYDPGRGALVGNYMLYYLDLKEKKEMDEIAELLTDIFNIKIGCK